ncbi:MAG: gliding motility-associated C-terminal domain-containing protein [Ferruginibacter sp.]|nr:gliding motility-associated C-terminal domain-containing protein [Ferruginibacter sp.]
MKQKKFTLILIFFSAINICNGQLCLGSLGDPIVNNTFGSGTNPGPPLAAATTTYQYSANDCPNDGFYTVRNSTSSCFGNTWHSFNGDHTGNPNGYFMLVNASVQPSAFYLDTVRALCGNTTFEFAAWIMNVILSSGCNGNSNQPNLTFSIEKTDGAVLQTYNTGNIAPLSSPLWKQYGFFFTTPVGVTDIVLRIFNNAQGGCGNDLALDDITFRPCGPLLSPSITGVASNTTSLCEGNGGNYAFTCTVSGGINNPVYQWQERINNNTWADISGENTLSLSKTFAANTLAGIYEYRLAVSETGNLGSPQCRINSEPLRVIINPTPVTTVINNGPVCERTNITLTATGGSQYQWNGPNGFAGSGSPLLLTNIQLNNGGKYYVTVTNAVGCIKKDSTIIVVNPAPLASTSFASASICLGDSIQLLAAGGPPYFWIPPAGLSNATIFNPKASPAQTTAYSVIVANAFGCADTATSTITLTSLASVNAGPDKAILKGQKLQLSGTVTGQGISYSWSPPLYIDDIYTTQPLINPPSDFSYILTASSGCNTVADTMFVKVYNDIFIPNAFTPNADGKNDTWNINALEAYPGFELFVFDRYGQLVFKTNKAPAAWNGTCNSKPCMNGIYTYVIKTGKDKDPIKGTVMIIR